MAASKINLAVDQGATYTKRVTWKTGKPATPVDLTGASARMQVRAKVDSPDILLSLTSPDGGITLGGAAGTVDIRIEATATAGFQWKSGVYDLEIQFADGTVRRLLAGSVAVSPEVTR